MSHWNSRREPTECLGSLLPYRPLHQQPRACAGTGKKAPTKAQGLDRGVLGRQNMLGSNLSLPANATGKMRLHSTPAIRASRELRFPSLPGLQDTHIKQGGVGRLKTKGWKVIYHANVNGKEAELAA